jgi:hypothetical protein
MTVPAFASPWSFPNSYYTTVGNEGTSTAIYIGDRTDSSFLYNHLNGVSYAFSDQPDELIKIFATTNKDLQVQCLFANARRNHPTQCKILFDHQKVRNSDHRIQTIGQGTSIAFLNPTENDEIWKALMFEEKEFTNPEHSAKGTYKSFTSNGRVFLGCTKEFTQTTETYSCSLRY